MLADYEAEVLAEDYAVDVTYTVQLPISQAEGFTAAIVSLTNGQALIERVAPDVESSVGPSTNLFDADASA